MITWLGIAVLRHNCTGFSPKHGPAHMQGFSANGIWSKIVTQACNVSNVFVGRQDPCRIRYRCAVALATYCFTGFHPQTEQMLMAQADERASGSAVPLKPWGPNQVG